MQLIADSGSTKTTWCVEHRGVKTTLLRTGGFNPFFQTEDGMRDCLAREVYPSVGHYHLQYIHFYGAGCAFAEQKELVRKVLREFWADSVINVESDLLGAARSLCGKEAGIACILGTGSNSCLFDGDKIISNVSPLGFILGDEGSGASLGKTLVADCLKGLLPPEISRRFMDTYSLTPQIILDNVYRHPYPNRFLAGFAPFISENISVPEIRSIAYNSFRSFFLRNVTSYKGHDSLPIHFTGSVAFFFRDILAEAALSLGIRLGKVERDPLEGLVRFHKQ